ncbi:hypothetical protein [Pedobacter sp. JCM 36344]|uniref:hypothetical protein n=1 Tax=Pedobacter sp. JCM 36344 TaxID=3374280 RepID=UPI00397D9637
MGCFLFVPAANTKHYDFFLVALYAAINILSCFVAISAHGMITVYAVIFLFGWKGHKLVKAYADQGGITVFDTAGSSRKTGIGRD